MMTILVMSLHMFLYMREELFVISLMARDGVSRVKYCDGFIDPLAFGAIVDTNLSIYIYFGVYGTTLNSVESIMSRGCDVYHYVGKYTANISVVDIIWDMFMC